MAQDVLTGFLDGDQVHGRPVGVGIDGTGALLVADDAGNTVWRVADADGSITEKPIGTDMVAAAPGGSGPAAADTAQTPPSAPAPVGTGQTQGATTQPGGSNVAPKPSQTQIAPAVLPQSVPQESDQTRP
jgi:hypothetical protein